MRSATVTTVLSAPQPTVFEYISDIENLPEWATEFARELRREGDDYKVVNGLGEFFFAIRSDRASGVIDMFAGPTKDEMAVSPRAPSRCRTVAPPTASRCSRRPACPTSSSRPSTPPCIASSATSSAR
jgi:hypothetical protein